MKTDVQEMIDRAAKRVEWSARALAAAADDLLAAGEHGAVVNGTAGQLRAASADVAELVGQIAADRARSDSNRRLRHAL